MSVNSDRPVSRRHVFYCMGYDPQGPAFYHALFRHQFDLFCNRFGLVGSVTPRRDAAGGIVSRWDVQLSDVDWEVNTSYSFLRWDDLVKADLRCPFPQLLMKKLWCDVDAVATGTIFRLCWLNWRFGLASLYSSLALLGLLILALLLAGGLAWIALPLGVPAWLALPAGVLLSAYLFVGGYRLLSRKGFLKLLIADGIFSMQHARGRRQAYLDRLEDFADCLSEAIQESVDDEVLVVGHSSGSFCAVEVLARALRRHPELARRGPKISLLTVGANLPLIGCHPQAQSFRDDVALLACHPELFWLEYQSPLDLLNFPQFDAGRQLCDPHLRARLTNPVIYDAHLREAMDPHEFARQRWNIWRLHFQFLMAIDRVVPCDYMMIVAGPATLELRGTDPAAALQMCYADAARPLPGAALRPSMPLPTARQADRPVPTGGHSTL